MDKKIFTTILTGAILLGSGGIALAGHNGELTNFSSQKHIVFTKKIENKLEKKEKPVAFTAKIKDEQGNSPQKLNKMSFTAKTKASQEKQAQTLNKISFTEKTKASQEKKPQTLNKISFTEKHHTH